MEHRTLTADLTGAEVRPAVDLARLSLEWDLACGREERTERTLAEVRLEKGRLLVEARKAFPARGPAARGWSELLKKWRIDQQRAWEYMKLADYVEQVSPQSGEIPTQVEAGIRRPPEPEPRPLDFAPTPAVDTIDGPADDLSDIANISDGIKRHARSLFNLAQRLAGAQANKTGVLVSPHVLNGLKAEVLSARAQLNDFCRLMGWMK